LMFADTHNAKVGGLLLRPLVGNGSYLRKEARVENMPRHGSGDAF
jgi:hypothetical protein